MSVDPSTAAPTVPAPATPVVPEPAAQPNEAELPQWARESLAKANREAAAYRVQVAELKPLADQHIAAQEAAKTEAQRLSDAAAAAQADAATARAEATRYKVAATHQIPAEHFDLLGTGSEEEITGRAQKIAAMLAGQVPPATVPPVSAPVTRPVAALRSGATPEGVQSEDDVLYDQLFGAKK